MDWNQAAYKDLLTAVLSLKSPAEAGAFLRDLLTEGEIEEFAKRLETAKLLSENKSYEEVQEETGFSTTTIARVSKWLQKGSGYKTIIPRLHHAHAEPRKRQD